MSTASTNETSQLTIRELTDFSASLGEALRRDPNGAALLPAVEQSLSAECVQCGIRLSGAEVLKLGAPETAGDTKTERLKSGYCARNGCDSLYYRLTKAPHPQLNWQKLLEPAQAIASETRAEAEHAVTRVRRSGRRRWTTLRISITAAVILILFLVRHIYMGGSIPFIREPEQFRVDRGQ